jgi:mRNA interferase MazF
MYAFGDVLIINFPFSDDLGSKRRPVMVIKDTNDKDVLIAKITSQAYSTSYDADLQDWKQGGLLSPSVVRIHKIQTLHSSLIFGHIGRLTSTDLNTVKKALMRLITDL